MPVFVLEAVNKVHKFRNNIRFRRRRLQKLVLLNVYNSSKFCPTLLEIVDFRVPNRIIIYFTYFYVDSNGHDCSCRCASAANVIRRVIGALNGKSILLKNLLN